MKKPLLFLCFVFPWTILSHYVGGKLISPGFIAAFFVAAGVLLCLLTGKYKFNGAFDSWLIPFAAFFLVGCVSVIFSPYGKSTQLKGVTQLAGIFIMFFMAYAVSFEVRRDPAFLLKITRCMVIVLGVTAVIGLMQFLWFNTRGSMETFNFSFMNAYAGGKVWSHPSAIGNVCRANSIYPEPFFMAHYLAGGAGVALIRLGLLGKSMRQMIASVVPVWAALVIVVAYFITLSILAYLLIIVLAVALWLMSRRFTLKSSGGMLAAGFFLLLAATAMSYFAGKAFRAKLDTIGLIFSADSKEFKKSNQYDTSALALAVNMNIMDQSLSRNPLLGSGLGSHPAAYKEFLPDYVRQRKSMVGLNAQDAASLGIRLLSETGVIGLVVFIAACGFLIVRVRSFLLKIAVQGTASPFFPVSVGILASTFSLVVIYLIRYGVYYEVPFWLLMGLTASIPAAFHET